ncbi:MAG TPA: hypothetical protein VES66_03425 [Terriglobales bacterium]|nr:hypothetical protein [Terriglobales bacterium]
MKLTIDNFDNRGPVDYSDWIDAETPPHIRRRLNQPSELRFTLAAGQPQFVVPVEGARVVLARSNGASLFTGYISTAAEYEYLGWAECGPAFRYSLVAAGDELLLDRKTLPFRAPFVARTAGDILRQLADDALQGALDCSAAQPVDVLPSFASDPRKTWSQHAADVALLARASYRVLYGKLVLEPVGTTLHMLSEGSAGFCPESLKLSSPDTRLNDVTVSGLMEPQLHVKDYFLGDGLTLSFSLSHTPFTKLNQYFVEDEFAAMAPDARYWKVSDPGAVVSVSGGALEIQGGTGQDGQTTVTFVEQVELGGALALRHGEVSFSAASNGIIGGLYAGSILLANCFAGFRITPSASQSTIQALVNGAVVGTGVTTTAGHRYALTTHLYASEIFRKQQIFHSSVNPAGAGRGGAAIAADVRVLLEVHDIDPANAGSLQAISTVLYDGIVAAAPAYCSYVLADSLNLHVSINYTQLLRVVEAEVRSALPTAAYRTRLVGALADGAECALSSSSKLLFFPAYVPAPNEGIKVSYRSRALSVARVVDGNSAAGLALGPDPGVRSGIRHVTAPPPRTTAECEIAARALLDDTCQKAWAGEYDVPSDFFPASGEDVFPGDAIAVQVPSRAANFTAIVREVDWELVDLAGERGRYKIRFANDAAQPVGFTFQAAQAIPPGVMITTAQVGNSVISDLPLAEITATTSTTVTIDAGVAPPAGGGIEVRRADSGWGAGGDRYLVGRFSTRTFTVPRLSRTQNHYLRQYDASSPPRYSRYSTALHLDYPY